MIIMYNQSYTLFAHPFYTLHFHRKAEGSRGAPNSLKIAFCSAVTSVAKSLAVFPILIASTLIRRNRSRALLTEKIFSRFRINRSICSANTQMKTWALIQSSVHDGRDATTECSSTPAILVRFRQVPCNPASKAVGKCDGDVEMLSKFVNIGHA